MNQKIGLVNYGIAGNITSIKRAIEKAGGYVIMINDKNSLSQVDKVVLPGVGSFTDAISGLNQLGITENLKQAANDKPFLGICLGMQILATVGFEFGETKGLDYVDAEIHRIKCHGEVPHMGFNSINVVKSNDLLKGVESEEFYFMHSYEMINYTDVAALTIYHGHQIVSSIKKHNLYGVQFHPEKSRDAGIELFKNFIAL